MDVNKAAIFILKGEQQKFLSNCQHGVASQFVNMNSLGERYDTGIEIETKFSLFHNVFHVF